MKRFLKHIFIILGLFISLMVLLDKAYSYTFKNGIPRSKIQKILQEKDKHYDVAFFGSSRAENHIDCQLIEQLTGKTCVNFGISGGTPKDVLMLVQIAENNGITYNQAFLQVDSSYNKENMSPNFKARISPFNEVINLEDESNISLPFINYLIYDRVVGFREFWSIALKRKPKSNIDYGFNPKYNTGLEVPSQLPSKINDSNYSIEKLSQFWKKINVKQAYFTAPYCAKIENRNVLNVFKNRFSEYKEYATVFDDNLLYFSDCGHLNFDGAQVFTKLIVTDFNL